MSKPKHHIRQEVCSTRAPYRDGRKPTAVKVYTIHHESKYLIVQGVPSVGASDQLVKLLETVGDLDEHKILDDYPGDQFTEAHLIKYKRIQSARFAKRRFDDWSFYGGVLHVCYAPEFETVQETREKLRERRRVVESKTRQYKSDGTYSGSVTQTSFSSSTGDDSRKTGHQQTVSVYNKSDTEQHTHPNYDLESTRNEIPSEQNLHMTAMCSQNTGTQQSGVYSGSYSEAYQYQAGQSVLDQQSLQSVLNQQSLQSVLDQQSLQSVLNQQSVQSVLNQHSLLNQQFVVNQPNMQSTETHVPALHLPPSIRADNGNVSIEQYGSKARLNQKASYAEQVVQQARSLQNYGRSTTVTKEIRTKRQSLDTVLDTSHEADQGTQNVITDNEEELILPPPPKQTKFSHVSSRKLQKYGGAKVPSAQATFPVDFDARTDGPKVLVDRTQLKEPYGFENDLIQVDATSKSRVDQNKAKTMQEKLEENLKNENVVIKDFSKKGTVPKFIPRQAQIKMKLNKKPEGNKPVKVASKTDELNMQIRKNAFKLGKAQGPADLGPSTSNESLDSKEKSVMDSMLEIRKKLTKVKDLRCKQE